MLGVGAVVKKAGRSSASAVRSKMAAARAIRSSSAAGRPRPSATRSSLRIDSTSSGVTRPPSASGVPWRIHCQIWQRAISAVAASSIRSKIATAPVPRSQASK